MYFHRIKINNLQCSDALYFIKKNEHCITYFFVYTYIHIYVHIYIHIYIHTRFSHYDIKY